MPRGIVNRVLAVRLVTAPGATLAHWKRAGARYTLCRRPVPVPGQGVRELCLRCARLLHLLKHTDGIVTLTTTAASSSLDLDGGASCHVG